MIVLVLVFVPFYVFSDDEYEPTEEEEEEERDIRDINIRIYISIFGRNAWFTVPESQAEELDVDHNPSDQDRSDPGLSKLMEKYDNDWREHAECANVDIPDRDYTIVAKDLPGNTIMGEYDNVNHVVYVDVEAIKFMARHLQANFRDVATILLMHEALHAERGDTYPGNAEALKKLENKTWDDSEDRYEDVYDDLPPPLVSNGEGSTKRNNYPKKYNRNTHGIDGRDWCAEE